MVWVAGSNGSNTFTVTMDGTSLGTQTGGNGPVSIPMDTTKVANGTHTLSIGVRDSSGKTGTGSASVTTSNVNVTPAPIPVPTPTPTPTPTPAPTGSLQVAITQPTTGATVSGTAWVVMWVNGASSNVNTYTLSVDGRQVATQVSGSGPVSVPWTTTGITNGTHIVTATVRDAAGKSGTTSVNVTVRN